MLGLGGGSWNCYEYVANSPDRGIDPDGRQVWYPPNTPPPPIIWPHWGYCGPNGDTDYDPCCKAETACNGAREKTPSPISGDDACCKDHDCCWAKVQRKTHQECG